MRKPKLNERMMVNSRVRFVSNIVEDKPGVFKYFMSDQPGGDSGFWYSVHELREEGFQDYLFSRPGYFGPERTTDALRAAGSRLLPFIAGLFMGSFFALVGTVASAVFLWRWISSYHNAYVKCCKRKEESV